MNQTHTNTLFTWPVSLFLLLAANSCTFSSKTQHRLFNKIEKEQFDVIIVPGVPFENNQWDRVMKGRVYWSKYLYDKGIAKNIIYSGAAVYSPYYEGKIMALYAAALGIPQAHIYTETRAEHSTENIYYACKLAKKLGFNRIALASDPFQTKLLRKFIRKKIDPSIPVIPFVVDTLKIIEPGMIDPPIDYQQAFKKDFISIKQRESFWKRWRGTRGKNVDPKAYD
ncbi:MAG TPA: YdcF family protein [Chitinophagaceae bacterium]|nr:YdcF family protein [Chitinophagaceae bacterium]